MNTGANSYINSSKNRKGACDFLRWQLTDTLKHFADRQTTAKGGGFDVALIAVGAYQPRWFMKEQHVNPAEAVQIHQDLKAKRSVGVHWGTFALTDEPHELGMESEIVVERRESIVAAPHVQTQPGDPDHDRCEQ